MTLKTAALLFPVLLIIFSANAVTVLRAEQVSSPVLKTEQNEALAHSIVQLFSEDQALLSDLAKAKKDPAFQQTYKAYIERVKVEDHNPNFYDPAVYSRWAQTPDAPEIVRSYVKFRKSTDLRIQFIVAEHGWPQRGAVGDEAAADFFFLFGHADDDNAWRVTQLPTITRVFREDHLNPRMYAHMCDRLANVAGKPQIYGSVMGPGKTPGTAKLYWPLIDNIVAADDRRVQIGLPSIEDDLQKFRQGADIGPYMTPIMKGQDWSMADVYKTPYAATTATKTTPIKLSVDLRDAPQKVLHATETVPVTPGELTLVYPKWIPGEHGPTGPIDDQAGLFFTGNGQPIPWQRDPIDMYSYHLTVPAGVTSLQVKMDFLATPNNGSYAAGGSTSANLAVLSWNTVVLYPYTGPNTDAKSVTIQPSITLPDGWRYGTSLETTSAVGLAGLQFKSVNLEQLIDSPVLAGRYFREVELKGDSHIRHSVDMAADGPEDLNLPQAHVDQFSRLIAETGELYRSRHYSSYRFLITLSDQVAHFGLEHHQSSDDRVEPTTFIDDEKVALRGELLPHELTHSWNGEYRCPDGLATPNYQVPMVTDLLWVYEGLTAYLGDVLAVRSGIRTPELYRDRLAVIAATYNNRPGRTWRPLRDTARMAQVLYLVGGAYDNWRLDTDFHDQGELVWLSIDPPSSASMATPRPSSSRTPSTISSPT